MKAVVSPSLFRDHPTCNALPLEKGRTPVFSAIPWITDSTTVQNIVIIAVASLLQRLDPERKVKYKLHSLK